MFKFLKFFSLSAATINAISSDEAVDLTTGNTITIKIDPNFSKSGFQLLNYFLQDIPEEIYDQFINHGCWCSRLGATQDPIILSQLGGPTTIDDLDQLCKSWFKARNCNKNFPGGSCFDLGLSQANDMEYEIDFTSETCHVYKANDPTKTPFKPCELDTCSIDVHFANLIREKLVDITLFDDFEFKNLINDGDFTCPKNSGNLKNFDKECQKDATDGSFHLIKFEAEEGDENFGANGVVDLSNLFI